MEEKLSGIVLGGVSVGENDKILNVFTIEQGVVSAKIKGVKKAGAKLKFASQPFCFAEFIFAKTGKNRTVIGASLIESFYPLREEITKLYAGSVVLEYCKKFLKEGIESKELFTLTINSLKNLAYLDQSAEYILCDFLVKALALSGYALNFNGCFECADQIKNRVFFDYSVGGFYCEECKTAWSREISIFTYLALKKIIDGEKVQKQDCVKPLKLLEYYLKEKAEVTLYSLKELINLNNI